MTQSIIMNGQTAAVDSSSNLVARARKALADYRVYRATVQELSQLTDRELADLGIHRSSINGIARESVYGA